MSKDQSKEAPRLESPETITKRIEGHIIRGTLDEERRAQKALVLLRARDRRIAFLEREIMKLANRADNDSRPTLMKFSLDNSSCEDSSRETTYLSISPTEATNSRRISDEMIFNQNDMNLGKNEKSIEENGSFRAKSIPPDESIKKSNPLSIPRLKLPAVSITNSAREAVILRNINPDFNESSSRASEESRQDVSSVNLVVTAALAFSKYDDAEWRANDHPKVLPEKRELNDHVDKKYLTGKSSRKSLFSARLSTSLPGIKTRRSRKHRKRGIEGKIGKTLDNSNLLSRNLDEIRAGLNELLKKSVNHPSDDTSERNVRGAASSVQKQKVEEKVARKDAQEAASISDSIFKCQRKIASNQTCKKSNETFDEPIDITTDAESNNDFLGQKELSNIWITEDEPAPQWLIEEALKRGENNSKDNRSAKCHDSQNVVEDDASSIVNDENIIADLERQLSATRAELLEALTEQSNIKNKYKKALKNIKILANEEREEFQRKLVQICTSMLEKFGDNAPNNGTMKSYRKKHRRPLQHFGKLSKKMHRRLKIANLASSRLKREIASMSRELDEKSRKYDSMMKCFASLKMELKNTVACMNDLLNENASLREKFDEARELMRTRVDKERHEKINAAQFREIQRSRELTNLRKKSEEDVTTIAQLRGKLIRLESANSNRGFLLNSYKAQLADLAKDKDALSGKIKELEIDNNSLRNANSQLRANLTLINGEKEKLTAESEKSEKSEIDIRNRMQSKLATKYDRSMHEKIDTIKADYDKTIEALELKLKNSEKTITEYRETIKRFLKEAHEYKRELDAERDLSRSEASEREARVTACEILNITPGELTGFLKGRSSDTINSWLSNFHAITMKKCFAEDLGQFLFERAIDSMKN